MASFFRILTVHTGTPGSPYYTNLVAVDNGTEPGSTYAQFVLDFWNALGNSRVSGAVATVQPQIDTFESDTGATTGVETWSGGTSPGTSTEQPLPPATQGLIQLRTGVYVGGREIRGRIFVPSPTEGANTTGVPTQSARDLMTGAAEVLVDNGFYVYSPTHHQCAQIIAATPWTQWAVLRSRRD